MGSVGVLIGQGFDAHRFAPAGSGRELWIAGLYWPVPDSCSEADAAKYEGIEGDSDGDVAAHALIDALLAAARLGDIGSLFGVGADAHGAGMHGIDMLQEVVAHLASNGYTPASASVAIIGNRPKIGTRRAEAEAVWGGWLPGIGYCHHHRPYGIHWPRRRHRRHRHCLGGEDITKPPL